MPSVFSGRETKVKKRTDSSRTGTYHISRVEVADTKSTTKSLLSAAGPWNKLRCNVTSYSFNNYQQGSALFNTLTPSTASKARFGWTLTCTEYVIPVVSFFLNGKICERWSNEIPLEQWRVHPQSGRFTMQVLLTSPQEWSFHSTQSRHKHGLLHQHPHPYPRIRIQSHGNLQFYTECKQYWVTSFYSSDVSEYNVNMISSKELLHAGN